MKVGDPANLEALVGSRVVISKTVSESDVYLFAGITGDYAPHHVNEQYCQASSLGHRIAHGALIVGYMSAASSAIVRDVKIHVVSLGYDRIRFLKPVFFGDTVTVDYEIAEYEPGKRRTRAKVMVRNQNDQLVAAATHLMQVWND